MLDSKNNDILDKLRVMENERALLKKDLPNKKVVYKKFRHIDPEIINLKSGEINRLSTLDKNFKQALEESRIRNSMGIEFSPLW